MTLNLESAIKHCEEVAENQEECACRIDEIGADSNSIRECASEHRQLAEWLKELKAYRKAHEEIQHEPLVWEYGQAIEKCLFIIDHCLREVNADEESD